MSIKSFLQGTFFDIFYRVTTPPWVIDEAQPDLVALEAEGSLRGKSILDVGCGTGDNAIHLARRGYEVIGIDASSAAIKTAKEKARSASVAVDFRVFDAFNLSALEKSFDTMIDYGLFHQFGGKQLTQYVQSLASALEPEGKLIVQCFSNQGEFSRGLGPRRVSQNDLRTAFRGGWKIDWIRPAKYHVKSGEPYPAWLASITRGSREAKQGIYLSSGQLAGRGSNLLDRQKQGHSVTAFVRNFAGLPLTHENLKIVQGDILDYDSVEQAESGQDAVFSVLGLRPSWDTITKRNTILSDATESTPPMSVVDLRRRRCLSLAAAVPIIGVTWCLPSPSAAIADTPVSGIRFEHAIRALEHRHGGRLGVAALNVKTGAVHGERLSERFLLCSTFKLPVVAMVLKRVESGDERLGRQIPISKSELVTYSPVAERHVGGQMSVEALCAAAIEWSDNTAGNLLLESFGGPPALNAFLRSAGDPHTRLDRVEPELNRPEPSGDMDSTTPSAIVRLFGNLLFGTYLAPLNQKRLKNWTARARTGQTRLRAAWPVSWPVGDKTGTGPSTTNDVAWVQPEGGSPWIIAAYYADSKLPKEGQEAVLADVGRAFWKAFK